MKQPAPLLSALGSPLLQRPRPSSRLLSVIAALLISGALCAAPPAVMDREQVAQHIARHYQGKILDLQPVAGDGQVYRVKLLQPSGRVRLMLINAQDGSQRPFATARPEE